MTDTSSSMTNFKSFWKKYQRLLILVLTPILLSPMVIAVDTEVRNFLIDVHSNGKVWLIYTLAIRQFFKDDENIR